MPDKKRKYKKKTVLIFGLIIFFLIYILAFNLSVGRFKNSDDGRLTNIDSKNYSDNTLAGKEFQEKQKREAKKSLIESFKGARKIYIGDNKVSHIRVSGVSLENFHRYISNFIKLRDVDKGFNPIYRGKSSNGIDFLTDFNYLELKSGNKKEFFKIPVSEKEDFQNMYRKLMYTSVEFITNGEKIGSVRVYHDNDEKSIWFWKKKELLNKILYKREVGKIQPEKEFSQTKDNYTIKLDKSGVKISIQTMGKDFIRVNCGDNIAYYEVYPDLYTYLYNMFK